MSLLDSPEHKSARYLHWVLICVPALVLLGSLSGASVQGEVDGPWFAQLVKPDTFPPPHVFGIVWSVLYCSLGFALALIISAYGARGRRKGLALFAVQFVLNLAWSPVFFGMHRMSEALVLITLMLLVAIATTVQFLRVRPVAGLLMLPYLMWLAFAAHLNFAFLQENPQFDGVEYTGAVARFDI